MRTILFFLLAGLCHAEVVDRTKLLCAVVVVEATPGRGANGELGPYQLTRGVWARHSALRFNLANAKGVEGDRVALAHLAWLQTHVDNPTPYRLALAWNAGLGAVQRNSFSDSSVDYAHRVRNVYEESNANKN